MTCNSWLYFALHGGFGVQRSNSIYFSLNDGFGQYQLICVFRFTWMAALKHNTSGTPSGPTSNPVSDMILRLNGRDCYFVSLAPLDSHRTRIDLTEANFVRLLYWSATLPSHPHPCFLIDNLVANEHTRKIVNYK